MRTTQTKFLRWRDSQKVERVGRHFSYFKKHVYQSCSKEGKLGGGGVVESNRKPEIFSFCGEVLALTWLFFQIGGFCVACHSNIFVLLHFVWKLVISKTRRHKDQRTVSHIFAQMIVDVCLFSNKDVNQWKFCKSKEKVGTSKT